MKPYGAGVAISERPYSVILCLSDNNIQVRQRMIDYFKEKMLNPNQSQQLVYSNDDLRFTNSLCFLIKRQPFSMNVSKFMHGNLHKPYEITGPYVKTKVTYLLIRASD